VLSIYLAESIMFIFAMVSIFVDPPASIEPTLWSDEVGIVYKYFEALF